MDLAVQRNGDIGSPGLGGDEVVELQEQVRVLVDEPLAATARPAHPSTRCRRRPTSISWVPVITVLRLIDASEPPRSSRPDRACCAAAPDHHPSLALIEQRHHRREELGELLVSDLHPRGYIAQVIHGVDLRSHAVENFGEIGAGCREQAEVVEWTSAAYVALWDFNLKPGLLEDILGSDECRWVVVIVPGIGP